MKNKKTQNERPVRYDQASLPKRILDLLLLTVLVTLIVEGFNQGSIARMFRYLINRPLYFGFNCLVVLSTMSLTELTRSRRALSCTLAALWVILGFSNYLVCRDRIQPLVSGDLIFTREILGLTVRYFGWFKIILVFILALALIFLLARMYARMPRREKVNYPKAVACVLSGVCCAFLLCIISSEMGIFPDHFGDRVDAYHDYGFTTCFSFTFGAQGIDEPEEYSGEAVTQILDEIDEPAPTQVPAPRFDADDNLKRPNIVFVQLESFLDMEDVIGAAYSTDPTPNFHKLLRENPNGILYVPTIGGGTANVEFEIMTGMNMDFFSAGEAPFNTILQQITCESIAHDLRKNGYHTSALHNNTGFFFSRNKVYANLGFDRFVPLECMSYPEYTENGWAHDTVLKNEILTIMENSPERDLVCAITVESHGKYPDSYAPKAGDVEILSFPEEAYLASAQNYINTLPAVDAFIGELIAAFERYDEPVMVVFYGDHLPAVGLRDEMLVTGDLYASRYLIWNNYGAKFAAPDLQSYRLCAELFRQLGIADGVMTKFHQAYSLADETGEYMQKFQTLQYDLLFGEQNAYGDAGSYAPSDIVYSAAPIEVHSVEEKYGRMLVKGENFTQFSKIMLGDTVLETIFVDDQTLAAPLSEEDEPLEGSLCVAQINNDGKELVRTAAFDLQK